MKADLEKLAELRGGRLPLLAVLLEPEVRCEVTGATPGGAAVGREGHEAAAGLVHHHGEVREGRRPRRGRQRGPGEVREALHLDAEREVREAVLPAAELELHGSEPSRLLHVHDVRVQEPKHRAVPECAMRFLE